MNNWIDLDLVLLVLTGLTLLGSSRMGTCIRAVALQGLLLSPLALLLTVGHGPVTRAVFLAVVTVVVKGFGFPWLLDRALRGAGSRREVEPFIGYNASLLLGVLVLAVSFQLGHRLPLPADQASPLVVPVAFFNIFVGLLLIASRRKAITQVLGYLVIENGIYVFGVGAASHQPLLVELGILLDVFAAVFVMGIVIFHIGRQFDHIDADRLTMLNDRAEGGEAP